MSQIESYSDLKVIKWFWTSGCGNISQLSNGKTLVYNSYFYGVLFFFFLFRHGVQNKVNTWNVLNTHFHLSPLSLWCRRFIWPHQIDFESICDSNSLKNLPTRYFFFYTFSSAQAFILKSSIDVCLCLWKSRSFIIILSAISFHCCKILFSCFTQPWGMILHTRHLIWKISCFGIFLQLYFQSRISMWNDVNVLSNVI